VQGRQRDPDQDRGDRRRYVTTVVKGEVGNVKAAIEAGLATLKAAGAEVIAAHVIPQPHDSILGLVERKA
jgi:microcompartment protein CcmL/EutN